jgi:hypothetical protein
MTVSELMRRVPVSMLSVITAMSECRAVEKAALSSTL